MVHPLNTMKRFSTIGLRSFPAPFSYGSKEATTSSSKRKKCTILFVLVAAVLLKPGMDEGLSTVTHEESDKKLR
jgi:hypothetical protein